FKRVAKNSVFGYSKPAEAVPLEALVKGTKVEVDNMELRTEKIQQANFTQKPLVLSSLSEHRNARPTPVKYSPDTLRRKLEQPLQPFPGFTQYVQKQQERSNGQSKKDAIQQRQEQLRRETQESLQLQQQRQSRIKRQSQDNLFQLKRHSRIRHE